MAPPTLPKGKAEPPEYHVGKSAAAPMEIPASVSDRLSQIAGDRPGVVKPAQNLAEPPNPPAAAPKPAQLPPERPTLAPPAVKEVPKTPEDDNTGTGGPKALREAYERTKARLKEIEEGELPATRKQKADLEAKAAAQEAELTEYRPLKDRLKKTEEERTVYEEKLRIRDYTEHPEFHEKFVKPVAVAVESARAMVKEMVVVGADGNERPGNDQDFDAVLSAPNITQAMRVAKAIFGDDMGPTVFQQRNTVITAERARQEAFRAAALSSKEAQDRQITAQSEAQSRRKSKYEENRKALLDKDADLFKADPDDSETLEAYETGAALADDFVHGNPKKSEDDFIANAALVRERAASFPVMAVKLKRAKAEIEELKSRLAAFEASEPASGGARRVAGQSEPNGAESDPMSRMKSELEKVANRPTNAPRRR